MQEKMNQATELSRKIVYKKDRTVRDIEPFGKEIEDLVWEWCDGLYQKWIMKRTMGECSLQDMIDFNLEETEKMVDETIIKFKELLQKIKGKEYESLD